MGKLNKKLKTLKKTNASKNGENSEQDSEIESKKDHFLESLNLPSDFLDKKISEDTKSVKSMKSLKNELGLEKKISKKDKIKLRQKVFLKKIANSTEFKKNVKNQAKKKNTKKFQLENSTTTKLRLKDNLPALGINLGHIDVKIPEKKKKPIAKASRRKKNLVRNVNLFRSIISDKNVLNNPFQSALDKINQKLEQGAI